MIESKFGLYKSNFIILPFLTFIIGFMLFDNISGYYFDYYFVKHIGNKGSNEILLLSFLFFIFLLSIGANCAFFYFLKKISINNQTITFKKIFMKWEKILPFKEIDGYYSRMVYTSYGSYEVLMFVADNCLAGTISSRQYSNFNDLKNAIADLKYLGNKKYGFLKQFKIRIGKQLP